MKTCAKCGFENADDAKQCDNCLIDLQYAKVNYGKFYGMAEDTKRIGIQSKRERGISIPPEEDIKIEVAREAPGERKTQSSAATVKPIEHIEAKTYKRVVNSSLALYLLLVLGLVLWLPGLISLVSALSGAPVRAGANTYLCYSGLAFLGGVVFQIFFITRGAQKIARNLVLTVDQEGLAESGYPKPEQNWALPWSKISQVKLDGTGDNRMMHIFTKENLQKAAHLLGGYPFDELVASFNAGLAPFGKSVQES